MDRVEKAFNFAKKKHENTLDDCDKNYFNTHVCHVVEIVKNVTNDDEIIVTAYLHDTLEDTETTLDELKKEFGERIANLVHELTHDGDKTKGYYFPRLKTKEAILIKFADRLSNLSRMESWSEKRKEHYLNKSRFWRTKVIE